MVEGSLSQPMLSPWLLSNGSELKFPEQACEQIALVIFGDQVHVCVCVCVSNSESEVQQR